MRDLHWDGYPNARDLGGLPTARSATGFTIPGRIARGPRRELLTDEGWADAHRWGVSTIVDLRCEYEIGPQTDDPDVDPARTTALTIVNAPTEDHNNPEFREACFPILDSPAYWEHNWRILPHLVHGALQAIASAESGVLVHCSAGRDRTGMITALLLGNAGVPPEVVADDYAESVRAMAGVSAHTPTHDRQSGWTAVDVDTWVAQTRPLVRTVARDAESTLARLGMRESERARLSDVLTSGTSPHSVTRGNGPAAHP